MFVRIFKWSYRSFPLWMAATCFFSAIGSARAVELYYEDFEDETLAISPTVSTFAQGTIAGGIISFNDTDTATLRNRYVVRPTTAYADPVLTYSFDVKAPVTVGASGTNELRLRAGIGTANNTLQAAEFIYEVLLFSNGTN